MKRKLLFLAVLAMLLASCSNDEGITPTSESLKDTPINVNVLVSNLKTRAGNDSEADFDKFYISIKQSEANDKYNYDNVVMKKEKGQWGCYESDVEGADRKELLWKGTDQFSVTASTSSMTGTAPYALSVAADQSAADKIKENSLHSLFPAVSNLLLTLIFSCLLFPVGPNFQQSLISSCP